MTADMTVLLVEKGKFRVVGHFYRVCEIETEGEYWKKSRLIMYEKKDVEMYDFKIPFRVSMSAVERCEVRRKNGRIGFKYLRTVLDENMEMNRDKREGFDM